jgi:Cu-Zn family superoxide dismutase
MFRYLAASTCLLALAACGETAAPSGSASPSSSTSATPSGRTIRVDLRDGNGTTVGTVTLTQVDAGQGTSAPASPSASGSSSSLTTSSPSRSSLSTGSASASSSSSAGSFSAGASPSAGSAGGSAVRFHVEITNLPAGSHGFHIHSAGNCDGPDFTTAGGHYSPTVREHGLLNPRGPHAGDLPNLVVGSDGRATIDFVWAGLSLDQSATDSLTSHNGGTSLIVHANVDDGLSQPAGNSGSRIACGVITAGSSASASASGSASPSSSARGTLAPSASGVASGAGAVTPSSSASPTR